MITAGCYTMHVLCDTMHRGDTSMEEFSLHGEREITGRSKRDAINNAKAAGWLFKRGGKTYCPTCAKALKRPVASF